MTETIQKNARPPQLPGSNQQFSVLVDTGSVDLFLPAAGAGPHNTVQPDPSILPYAGSPACSEAYGPAGDQGITGTIYTAPYSLAGSNAPPSSAFCLVSDEGSYGAPEDGVMGFGFCLGSSVAAQTGNCPLQALGWSSFGIYLSSDDQNGGGFITPNGVDDGLYTGDFSFGEDFGVEQITEIPVDDPLESIAAPGGAAPKHWIFSTGYGLYLIDGSEGFMNSYAFIDTGNPSINIEPISARDIWNKVGASAADGSIDCGQAGQAPDIEFEFASGARYTLPSSIWVVENPDSGLCRCTVQPQQTDPSDPAVFGAPFVKAYYTWFDNGNNRLGLAFLLLFLGDVRT
ncbi:hypothetical protein MMC28_002831 [Mycoblastus sanguinarius]|nr:hypothetical protein [Mycoblastus sanguinarius]